MTIKDIKSLRTFIEMCCTMILQQDLLLPYIEVKAGIGEELTEEQLFDQSEWEKVLPELLDAWEENTYESIKNGVLSIEEAVREIITGTHAQARIS